MFYKKCNTCVKKTCLKTKKICKSMDKWLKKYVEVPLREQLAPTGFIARKMQGLADMDHKMNYETD